MQSDLKLIAIEGHDGTGKTTLAKSLAEAIGAVYLRPFAPPWGDFLMWISSQNPDSLMTSGKTLIDYAVDKFLMEETNAQSAVSRLKKTNGRSVPIICDRHWLTVSSLITVQDTALYEDLDDRQLLIIKDIIDKSWLFKPPTLLCYANLDTTLFRLNQRNDPAEQACSIAYHKYYINLYFKLAHEYNVKIVDTNYLNEADSLKCAVEWVESLV